MSVKNLAIEVLCIKCIGPAGISQQVTAARDGSYQQWDDTGHFVTMVTVYCMPISCGLEAAR